MRRLLLVVLAAVVTLLSTAAPAAAHATLVSSQPADGARLARGPNQVELTFSEEVGISGDSVRVMDTDGDRVDDGRPRAVDGVVTIGIDGDLGPDTYVVAWRVVSADDHPIHGATTFVVGDGERASDALIASLLGDEGDGAWPLLGAIARALAYTGALLVIGGVAWVVFVDRAPLRRPARNLVVGGAALGAAGTALSIPIQAALSTGLGIGAVTDSGVLGDVVRGPLGIGVLLVALGVVLIALATRGSRRASLSASSADPPSFVAAAVAHPVAVAGALLVAVGFARSGHTETTDPRVLMYGADIVHVLTAGAWAGGLALLALDLRSVRRGHLSPTVGAEHVARFSALASVVSIAAGAAGVALAWGTVRNLDALTSTTYGRTLLVKVALVAAVGAAAFYNRRWLVPAVRQGADDARRLLDRSVRFEVAGLLAAVVVTAALVNIEPARLAASPGIFEQTVTFGDGSAVIQVDPAEAGDNSVHVYLLDQAGRQMDLDAAPTFSFTLGAMDIGPIEREPFRAGPGHYTIDGRELSIAGTWTVEVRGRISQFEEAVATVQVPVR